MRAEASAPALRVCLPGDLLLDAQQQLRLVARAGLGHAALAPSAVDRMLINAATVSTPVGLAKLNPADNTNTDRILIDGLFLDGFEDSTNRITVPFNDPRD